MERLDEESAPLDTTRIYQLSDFLHLKEDAGKLLVLDPRTYSVHELNPSAAIVARLCDGKRSCEEIVAEVVSSQESTLENAAEIVYRSLQLLRDQGLLETA